MTKIEMGKTMPPLPLPVCLLGSRTNGRPNFCTVAWFTMIDDEPPTIGLVIAKDRRTKDGVVENGTFSVNLPSTDQVVPVDYCGITSGHEADKSEVFTVFYGDLGTAPMVQDCPLTMECQLLRIVEFEGTDMVVGTISGLYADNDMMARGRPDIQAWDPLLYLSTAAAYYGLGRKVADAFSIGRGYKKER